MSQYKSSITSLGLKNFRVFKEYNNFELKPITILTGTNNCGKSTLQKVLYLLSKSVIQKNGSPYFDELNFDAEVIERINAYNANLNYNKKSDDLKLSFDIQESLYENLRLNLTFAPCPIQKKVLLFKVEVCQKEERVLFYEKITLNKYLSIYHSDDKDIQDQMPEDFYVWYLNSDDDITNLINSIYNLLLEEKKKEIRQNQISELELKLQKERTLNDSEKDLKKQFESEGLSFNDSRSMNYFQHMENESQYRYTPGELHVWDNNQGEAFYFDQQLKENCKPYYDLNENVLVPTKLSQIIFDNHDFFESNIENKDLLNIRKELIQNGIYNKELFIKSYNEFEAYLIYLNIFQRELPESYDEYIDEYQNIHQSREFSNFFMSKNNGHNTISSFLNQIASKANNSIAKILESNSYKALFQAEEVEPTTNNPFNIPISDINPSIKDKRHPKTYKDEIKNLGLISNRIQGAVVNPIKLLGESLLGYVQNLRFAFQDTVIKRYYFFSDIKKEDEVFVRFGQNILNKNYRANQSLKFINKWLSKFDLGEMLIVKPIIIDNNEVGINYSISRGGIDYPVGDNGLGANLVLLLLLRISMAKKGSTLMLEEPESNLHPAFQSLLAELLADAHMNYELNFIVETHSEYFIRKFQYLVANPDAKVKADDIAISYLYHPDKIPEGKKQVEKLEIRPDGSLDGEFGTGFFDEASNWKMELMRIKHAQKN